MLKAKPDKIEQEVFRVVSTIPEHAENWHDNRSSLRRFSEKRLSKNADALRDEEIKEKWTMQIVLRLTELGKSLGITLTILAAWRALMKTGCTMSSGGT